MFLFDDGGYADFRSTIARTTMAVDLSQLEKYQAPRSLPECMGMCYVASLQRLRGEWRGHSPEDQPRLRECRTF